MITIKKTGYAEVTERVTPIVGQTQTLNFELLSLEAARLARIPARLSTGQGSPLQLVKPGTVQLGAPRRARGRRSNEIEREVAIKRILPHYTEDEAFTRMFIDEATIAAKLHHANIVQIFDFDKVDDTYYIAMEFVEGKDLKKIRERLTKNDETLTVWQIIYTGIEVAKALHYAHSRAHKGKP